MNFWLFLSSYFIFNEMLEKYLQNKHVQYKVNSWTTSRQKKVLATCLYPVDEERKEKGTLNISLHDQELDGVMYKSKSYKLKHIPERLTFDQRKFPFGYSKY